MSRRVHAPELTGRGWLNTGGQTLRLEGLRGKIVLLDFWTFCCINCLHVLDELRTLENEFSDVLVVIGVHSPKFDHEKDATALANAIERYDIRHPVLDDPDLSTFYSYNARAWPTLTVIDPEGYIVGMVSGEGHAEALQSVIEQLIAEHEKNGNLRRGESPYIPQDPLHPQDNGQTALRFPAKLIANHSAGFFVTSAAQHQVVELAQDARTIVRRIGSGERGLVDGDADTAQLCEPHGMLMLPSETAREVGYDIVVADTVNHSLRGLELDGTVTRVAGTGNQQHGQVRVGRHDALHTELTSPWDLAWYDNLVIIAMAGSHQLWWFDPVTATVGVYAGTQMETLKDGTLLNAALAQPSGLSVSGDRLWIADSETSALRWIENDQIHTAIGHGLFDFGFVDGVRADALLQHPLGVCALSDGSVLVADTYNGAIRHYDPRDGRLETIAQGLAEPSDVFITAENDVLVVESAAHRVTQLASGVIHPEPDLDQQPTVLAPGEATINIDFPTPDGQKLDDTFGLPVTVGVTSRPESLLLTGQGTSNDLTRSVVVGSDHPQGIITVTAQIATCDTEATNPACHLTRRTWNIPVDVSNAGEHTVTLLVEDN